MFFDTLFLAAFALTSVVAVNPGNVLIDYNPAVTSPSGGEIWLAGGTYSVSWDQTIPPSINASTISQTAKLVLGYKSAGSNNLNWTLATDVPLYAPNPGSVTVTLPKDLELRSTYIIALIGSSGNTSKNFTILPSLFTRGKRTPLKASTAEKRRVFAN